MSLYTEIDSPVLEERVGKVYTALRAPDDPGRTEIAQQELHKVAGVLQKLKEPKLLQRPRRGALYEYVHVIASLNDLEKGITNAEVFPYTDSRARRDCHQLELWREAECLALQPHSMARLKQLPELQQIISYAAVPAIHACAGRQDHLEAAMRSVTRSKQSQAGRQSSDGLFGRIESEFARVTIMHQHESSLFEQLAPGLRLCLAAEVAVGMLCPGQPAPPDTVEHAAALAMFVRQAEEHARDELSHLPKRLLSSTMGVTLGPECNTAEAVRDAWQHIDTRLSAGSPVGTPRQSDIPRWALAPHLDLQLQLPPQQVLQLLCCTMTQIRQKHKQQQQQAALTSTSSNSSTAQGAAAPAGDADVCASTSAAAAAAAADVPGQQSVLRSVRLDLPFLTAQSDQFHWEGLETLVAVWPQLVAYATGGSSDNNSGSDDSDECSNGQAVSTCLDGALGASSDLSASRQHQHCSVHHRADCECAHCQNAAQQSLPRHDANDTCGVVESVSFTRGSASAADIGNVSSVQTKQLAPECLRVLCINTVLKFIEEQWKLHGVNSPAWQQAVPLQLMALCDLLNQLGVFVEQMAGDSTTAAPEQCCGDPHCAADECKQQQQQPHGAANRQPDCTLQNLLVKVVALLHTIRQYREANAELNGTGAVPSAQDSANDPAAASCSQANGAPDPFGADMSPAEFFSAEGPLATGLWGLHEPVGFGVWPDAKRPIPDKRSSMDVNDNSYQSKDSVAAESRQQSQQQQHAFIDAQWLSETIWQIVLATGHWQKAVQKVEDALQQQLSSQEFEECAMIGSHAAVREDIYGSMRRYRTLGGDAELDADAVLLLQGLQDKGLAVKHGCEKQLATYAKVAGQVCADLLWQSKAALFQALGLSGQGCKRLSKALKNCEQEEFLSFLNRKAGPLTACTTNFSRLADDEFNISSDEEPEQQQSWGSSMAEQQQGWGSSDSDEDYLSDRYGSGSSWHRQQDRNLGRYDDLFDHDLDNDLLDDEYWSMLDPSLDLESGSSLGCTALEQRRQENSARRRLQRRHQQQHSRYPDYTSRSSRSRRSHTAWEAPKHCTAQWSQHARNAAVAAAAEDGPNAAMRRRHVLKKAQKAYRELANIAAAQLTPLYRWHRKWLETRDHMTDSADKWWASPARKALAKSGATNTPLPQEAHNIIQASVCNGGSSTSSTGGSTSRTGGSTSSKVAVWASGAHDYHPRCPVCCMEQARKDSDTSNTCSSSSTIYSQPPVPYSDPFMWRRLLWQLLGKLSPQAQAFYAQYLAMCAHCSDAGAWKAVRESIERSLWSPPEPDAVHLQLNYAIPGMANDTRPARVMQYARALNKAYSKGSDKKPGYAILAQQLLLSLSPLHQQLLPGPEVAMLCPSSFRHLIGKQLMSELLDRQVLDLFQHHSAQHSMWHVRWHVGIRRYAALKQEQQQEAQCRSLDEMYLDPDARLYAVGFAARQLCGGRALPANAAAFKPMSSAALLDKAQNTAQEIKLQLVLSQLEVPGPEGDQAGCGNCQAGPDGLARPQPEEGAGPDSCQAEPEAHQAGPDTDQAGPDNDQAGPDNDIASLVSAVLQDLEVHGSSKDEKALTAAVAWPRDLLAPLPVRSQDSTSASAAQDEKHLVDAYLDSVYESGLIAAQFDSDYVQAQDQQQQQEVEYEPADVWPDSLTDLGALALQPPVPIGALLQVDLWWLRQQQLLRLHDTCDVCRTKFSKAHTCGVCHCTIYCSEHCALLDAEKHSLLCDKLQAVCKRYAQEYQVTEFGGPTAVGPFPALTKALQPHTDETTPFGMDCQGIGAELNNLVPRAAYMQQAGEQLASMRQENLLARMR